MSNLKQRKITGTSTSYTYVSMWQGMLHMLEIANKEEEGQLYTCTTALFYAAFMLEAYFNHIGREKYGEGWNDMEKKFSKFKKFKKFADEAGWDVDEKLVKQPYVSMIEIFGFRDALAHGKTTVDSEVNIIVEDKGSVAKSLPKPDWHTVASLKNVAKLCEDAEAIVVSLHKALGFKSGAFTTSGSGFYVSSIHNPNVKS